MKKVLTAGIIILSLIAIAITYYFLFGNKPAISYDKNRLLNNKEYYVEIAEICLEHRNQHGKDIICVIPGMGQVNAFKMYCYECDTYIALAENQIVAAKAVERSFGLDHTSLDAIRVYENFVSFGVVTGRASFIYSENNKKPSFVNSPDESGKKPFVKKITDNWYYACRIGS